MDHVGLLFSRSQTLLLLKQRTRASLQDTTLAPDGSPRACMVEPNSR